MWVWGPPGPGHSRRQSSTAGGEDLLDHVKEEGIALARLLCCRSHASHLWFLFCSLRPDSVSQANFKAVKVLLQSLSTMLSGVCHHTWLHVY